MQKFYNASVRNIQNRLRKIKDDLPYFIDEAIYEINDVIIRAISQDQLYRRGINGKGQKIMDYAPYKPSTIRIKKKKGQPTTRVTLKDTGSFYNLMYVVFMPGPNGGFYITSMDNKTEELILKYGPEIFRLTDENFTRIVRVHLKRKLLSKIKANLK